MRALVFDEEVRFTRDLETPIPAEGEALVRVKYAGVCATDLEIVKGYMGYTGTLGHEFTGTVEECTSKPELVGKRVVGEINIGCGECELCRRGLGNHCPVREVLGIAGRAGAFADFLTIPAENLHLVPRNVTDEEAVFTEPLAAAYEVTEQVSIGPGQRVCVVGDGRLGLLISQTLSLTGAVLVTVGRHREKLAILNARGIKTSLDIEGLEKSFDVVVDATGSPEGFETAVGLIKPRGTVVLKTTAAGKSSVDLNRLVIDEVTVVGSRCGPFEPALKALDDGKVDVRSLITKTFPIEEGPEALEFAKTKGVLKVLIKMD